MKNPVNRSGFSFPDLMEKPQRILVAPLDWGLGHATRCIPLIETLLAAGHQVVLAGAGDSLVLLQQRYPQLLSLPLPGYDVRYPAGKGLLLYLLRQLPRLLGVIRRENHLLQSWIAAHHLDQVISDNRYGMWSAEIPCFFLCHQLAPLPVPRWRWLHQRVYRLHLRWLRPFTEIWVPDFHAGQTLAGDLVHRFAYPEKVRFLGPLSRFQFVPHPARTETDTLRKKGDIVVILSGPEPQRSLFEASIRRQAPLTPRSILLVQGKPQQTNHEKQGNLTVQHYLDTEALYSVLRQAEVVISRPGYSSLMDYATLGLKQMILVPTPGQTEQQYLADRLQKQHLAYTASQKAFDLVAALQAVREYPGFRQGIDSRETLWQALSGGLLDHEKE